MFSLKSSEGRCELRSLFQAVMVSELFEDICGIREFTFHASLHKKIIWCSISKLKDKELVELMRRPVKIGSWMIVGHLKCNELGG